MLPLQRRDATYVHENFVSEITLQFSSMKFYQMMNWYMHTVYDTYLLRAYGIVMAKVYCA